MVTVTEPARRVLPFEPRGPLSTELVASFAEDRVTQPLVEIADAAIRSAGSSILDDDDIQLSLFVLYASHYGSLPGLSAEREWDLELIATRRILEAAFEAHLRLHVPMPVIPSPDADSVARALFDFTAPKPGAGLSRFVARTATLEQLQEFLIQRSIYTLREADPHSWAIPRLTGRPKAALVEIQSDEYGGGDPDRMHAVIFARTMRGVGLDDTYGDYVDRAPAGTLASLNAMSMFGINRRLRGAIVGHLAAFEMTSSIPNRSYGEGFRRVGFGPDVTHYFDEHVEADAVHEQIAGRDLAGSLAEDEPDLVGDIMFGAAACLFLDDRVADQMLAAFTDGRSSLRDTV